MVRYRNVMNGNIACPHNRFSRSNFHPEMSILTLKRCMSFLLFHSASTRAALHLSTSVRQLLPVINLVYKMIKSEQKTTLVVFL